MNVRTQREAGADAPFGGASSARRAEVDRLLRESPPFEPAPPGLRRATLARIATAPGARRRAPFRMARFIGPAALLGAACIALAIGALALRPGAGRSPAGVADAATSAPDPVLAPLPGEAPPSPGAIAIVERRLRDNLRALPARVESPLMQEAQRLASDTRRAALVVAAAWRPRGDSEAPGGATPSPRLQPEGAPPLQN